MRIGVMVGPERGRYATKVQRLISDAQWAEQAGLNGVWIPQIPDEFDALTACAVVAMSTERIEIGTAVVPVQPRHPVALAQQVLSTQAVAQGRLALGLGVSHHWIIKEMLGLPYEKPAAMLRDYLEAFLPMLAGPGTTTVKNDTFDVNQPLDVTDVAPTPVLLAALGPVMLRLAGEKGDGTILWLADEKAIGDHIAPLINGAAEAAGRPAPRIVAGVPVCLCADSEVEAATTRANRLLSEAEVSPNYQKLMEHGNAREVGDILAAGSEEAIEKRLRAFADAGATDLSVRVVPIGNGRDELIASSKRTRDLLSSLAATLR
ncbi:MAG TPA: TIGR03564 family F420-dependent LLM class oxidoreductase [Mycobacteriales bacterium]|nr:TIGR03564 family F420-dependent LLM class oxidoreductase [Mycobacteriales bacterium]